MNILITGSSGFIAKHLIQGLKNKKVIDDLIYKKYQINPHYIKNCAIYLIN